MESVIKKYPRAKIIWAHCWASRRLNIPNYIKIIERILREYENLYIDLSWVVFDEIVNKNRQTVDDWVLLSKKYNNRILIWSDVLWWGFHKIGIINWKFNNFLSKLNEEERLNITINNAEFLYKKSNIKNIDSQKIEFPKLFK
jgi:predicted TIM-barrel fold metal-dependent hydrolase